MSRAGAVIGAVLHCGGWNGTSTTVRRRLVSLGVTLSRIERRLDRLPGDTAQVGVPVESARGAVTDALGELRDIVRGIHPPALDNGLATALTTLASRSGLPVEVDVELRTTPPEGVATTV